MLIILPIEFFWRIFVLCTLQVVIDGDALNHPYGLAVYGSFIFWSEFLDSEIRRIRVGENGLIGRSRIVYSDKSSLFELHVFDPNSHTRQSY